MVTRNTLTHDIHYWMWLKHQIMHQLQLRFEKKWKCRSQRWSGATTRAANPEIRWPIRRQSRKGICSLTVEQFGSERAFFSLKARRNLLCGSTERITGCEASVNWSGKSETKTLLVSKLVSRANTPMDSQQLLSSSGLRGTVQWGELTQTKRWRHGNNWRTTSAPPLPHHHRFLRRLLLLSATTTGYSS